MSKYIIEIDDNAMANGCYQIVGTNSVLVSPNGLDELEKHVEKQSFPQMGSKYFFLNSSGNVECSIYNGTNIDKRRMAIGNFFETEEEAELASKRVHVWAEMRKFAEPFDTGWDGRAIHYYFYCDYAGELAINYHSDMRTGQLYFTSEKRARECIEAVGEDRIKKFYIGVE